MRMKKFSSLKLAATIAILVPVNPASAELFMVTPGRTSRLTIAQNEAVTFTSFGGGGGLWTEQKTYLVSGGKTNVVGLYLSSMVIAGPSELVVVSSNFSTLAEFIRTTNSNIRTHVLAIGSPLDILVPAGSYVRFFTPDSGDIKAQFQRRDQITQPLYFYPGDFSGPLSVSIWMEFDPGECDPVQCPPIVFSYAISDGPSIIPELGLIKVHSGSHEVAIEKSSDLRTWNTVLAAPVSASGEGFFRLRVVK